METQPDPLKEFEALARRSQSYAYFTLDLRDYWAAKRRDPDASPEWTKVGSSKKAKREFTDQQLQDMRSSTDALRVIAERNQTTAETVRAYRQGR